MKVLMFDGTESGALVRSTLAVWTSAGLLERYAWIELGAAPVPTEVTDVMVTVVEADGSSQELTLAAAVDGQDGDQLGLYALRFSGSSSCTDGHEAVRRLAAGALADGLVVAPLWACNVIVPAFSGQEAARHRFDQSCIDPEVLQPSWAFNVVLDPRDAASPLVGRSNTLLDCDLAALANHAALGVVAVAGIFSTDPDGGLDALVTQDHNQVGPVVVTRAYTRVLDAGLVLDQLVGSTLSEREQWPRAAPPGRLAPVDLPEAAEQQMAEQLGDLFPDVNQRELRYRPALPLARPDKKPLSVIEVLRKFIRHFVQAVCGLPVDLLRRGYGILEAKVVDQANSIFVGPDSTIVITADGRPPDGTGPRFDLSGDLRRSRLRDLLGVPTRSTAHPETWIAMRRLAAALVDGSDLPEIVVALLVEASGDDERPEDLVVTRPWLLAPQPEDVLDLDAVTSALAIDPARGDVAVPPVVSGACDVLGSRRLERWLTSELGAAGPATREAAADLVDEVGPWRARRARSFAWRVGAAIVQGIDDAAEDVQALAEFNARRAEAEAERLESGAPPEESDEVRERRRFRVLRIVALLLGFLLIGAVVAGALLTGVGLAIMVIGAVVTWVVGLFLAFFKVQLKVFQDQFQRKCRALDEDDIRSKGIQAASEIVRLQALYDDYVEVAELIGWLVHRPWGQPEVATSGEDESLASANVPAAMRVGRGVVDGPKLEWLRSRAERRLFTIGWLTKLLEVAEQVGYQTVAREQGATQEEIDQIGRDRSASEDAVRGALIRQLGNAEHAQHTRDAAVEVVSDMCAELSPVEMCSGVTVDGLVEPAGGFLSSILADVTDPSAVQELGFQLALWRPADRGTPPSAVRHTRLVVPKSAAALLGPAGSERPGVVLVDTRADVGWRLLVQILRLDVSAPLDAREFALFDAEGAGPTLASDAATDEVGR